MAIEIEQTHAPADIGQVFFVGSGDHVLMAESTAEGTDFSLADLETGDEIWRFEEPVDALPMRRVGQGHLVYPARDRPAGERVEVRRIEDFELIASFNPGSVTALAGDRSGRLIAAANDTGKVELWDAMSGALIATVIDGDTPSEALSFSSDGRWVAARDMAFDVAVNRVDQPAGAARRLGLSDGVALACHPSAPRIVIDLGTRLAVYGLETLDRIRELGSPQDHNNEAASELCFSPDGRLLLVGSLGVDALDLWDFETGRRIAHAGELGAHAFRLEFHPDGLRFSACRSDAGAIFRIETKSAQLD